MQLGDLARGCTSMLARSGAHSQGLPVQLSRDLCSLRCTIEEIDSIAIVSLSNACMHAGSKLTSTGAASMPQIAMLNIGQQADLQI